MQDSFDYNSVVLQEDDSENEEFVNIVVHEIGEALIHDQSSRDNFYENVNKLERSMSEHNNSHKEGGSIQIQRSMSQSSRREGSIHSSNGVHPLSQGTDEDKVLHPAHRELGEAVAPNMECEETAVEESELHNEFGTSLPSRLEHEGKRFSKIRSFGFFKKNRITETTRATTTTTTTQSSNSVKSNGSPKSTHSVKSSSGYTTDISDNLNDANQLSGNYLEDVDGGEDSDRTYAPHDRTLREEQRTSNEASDDTLYEPLGVHKRLKEGINEDFDDETVENAGKRLTSILM